MVDKQMQGNFSMGSSSEDVGLGAIEGSRG